MVDVYALRCRPVVHDVEGVVHSHRVDLVMVAVAVVVVATMDVTVQVGTVGAPGKRSFYPIS